MLENKCETCVECFKKHMNPRLKKKECVDYIESFEKILQKKQNEYKIQLTHV